MIHFRVRKKKTNDFLMNIGFFTRKKMWRKCNRINMSNINYSFFNLFDLFKFCKELNFEEDYIPTYSESIENDRNEKNNNFIDFDKKLSDLLYESDETTNEDDDDSYIEFIEGSVDLLKSETNIFRNSPISISDTPNFVKDTKKLKFNSIVRTILIPTAKEYEKYDLNSKLWYSLDDIQIFREDFVKELKIKILNK